MKRRTAIKNIGLGLSAGLTLPWINACTDKDVGPEIRYDGTVGIIGAGAAGLFAADILHAKGIQVKIFEASNRVGGRIRSAKIFDNFPIVADFPVELGADRIIGTKGKWNELISLMKVPTVQTASLDKFLIDDVVKSTAELLGDSDFTAVINFRNNLPSYMGNANVQAAAGLNGRVQGILNSLLGNEYGTSSNRLSAKALGEALALRTHDGVNRTLSINPMQDVLNSRFYQVTPKVELNRVITSVNYDGDKILLADSNNQTTEVDFLIVTTPISILKSGLINFTPDLPNEKKNAMNKIGMDSSIRMILEFKKNFWGDDISFIYGGVECPSYFSAGVGRSDFNKTLSLTINGAKAEQLSTLTDEDKVLTILAEMDAVFDGEATLNIRRNTENNQMLFVVKDWSKEPYILGGYSYPKMGGNNDDRVVLAASVGDKVFFAGEATDIVGDFGTVNGALNSGERVAFEVINTILQLSV